VLVPEGSLICGPLFLIGRDLSVHVSLFFGAIMILRDVVIIAVVMMMITVVIILSIRK